MLDFYEEPFHTNSKRQRKNIGVTETRDRRCHSVACQNEKKIIINVRYGNGFYAPFL
jgi:hypothetical protein